MAGCCRKAAFQHFADAVEAAGWERNFFSGMERANDDDGAAFARTFPGALGRMRVSCAIDGKVNAESVRQLFQPLLRIFFSYENRMRRAKFFAISKLAGFMSQAMILEAPAMRAPWIALTPTPPMPNTATVLPGVTPAA